MNYIIPKYFINKFEIKDTPKIFKIKYLTGNKYSVVLFGIIIKLDIDKIVTNFSNNHLYLKNIDEVKKYDELLNMNIKDYKSFIIDDQYIEVHDKIINENNIYLNIKYVQKTGFLNIPVISIYNG